MKTAIIYASKKGTTEKIAKYIAEKINKDHEITLIPLRKAKSIDINDYDKVILGTSIYAGQPQKVMKDFYNKYKDSLEQKDISLYVCCMEQDLDKCKIQMENAYPESLHNKAKSKAILGGEFLFEKMNFIERLIVKKVANIDTSISKINFDAIDDFSKEII